MLDQYKKRMLIDWLKVNHEINEYSGYSGVSLYCKGDGLSQVELFFPEKSPKGFILISRIKLSDKSLDELTADMNQAQINLLMEEWKYEMSKIPEIGYRPFRDQKKRFFEINFEIEVYFEKLTKSDFFDKMRIIRNARIRMMSFIKTRSLQRGSEKINNQIIILVKKALQRIDDDSSLKDHIRRAFNDVDPFALQEDHFRDKVKNYLDEREGFRVDTENVTKVDGLSDIKLIKGVHRRTISVKIWNRFDSKRDPIEQLLDDMGTGERIGFHLMISDLKSESIKEKYVNKFVIGYKLSAGDEFLDIDSDGDIFILESYYERNAKKYSIIHILLETRQFLRK